MKSKLIIAALSLILFTNNLLSEELKRFSEDSSEKKKIENIIVESYIEGIFLKGNADLVKKGWHPECDIVILEKGMLKKLPVTYWVKRFENNPKPLDTNVTFKIKDIKVTDYAAIAIVDIYTKGKHLYTDYMCLYKFNEGWKIVTKIFNQYSLN